MPDARTRVLLLTGPAGAGKSTIARTLAEEHAWVVLEEDAYWRARGLSGLRSPEQEAAVQDAVLSDLAELVPGGRPVVIDLILYRFPPNPITRYRAALAEAGIPCSVAILRPTAAEIAERMRARGRPDDLVHPDDRAAEARAQLRVADSEGVDHPEWMVRPGGRSASELGALVTRLPPTGPDRQAVFRR